jgi:AmmeMemoRadiSam system protein A
MKDEAQLTDQERSILLAEARHTLEACVQGEALEPINLSDYPAKLQQRGVVFVTLTIEGRLRGCVGALEAYQPLIEDVREHTIAAALRDFRFQPVSPEEVSSISIEISRLTAPQRLDYQTADDLVNALRPGVDGVILSKEPLRATFLPQVWEKLPLQADFLNHLCQKMGAQPDLWRTTKLDVMIYQVEEFHE